MKNTYVILVEHCMYWTRLSALNGSSCYKDVAKAYNFRIKSETVKWSIATGDIIYVTKTRM
jgi:hypothetical protein